MKKGLLSLLLLISIAGFSQSSTTISALPRKNAASLGDTIITQNTHTYQYTVQQLYDLLAGNFLTTPDLQAYEQSSHATATYLRKVDTSFLHDQIAQLTNAKLNSGDTSFIHAQIVQILNAISTKFNISDTSILHAQIAQAVAAIAANTTAISNNTTAIAGKQNTITLTTTGTSGAATFNPTTGALNIPNYAGGGGGTSATDIEITDATKGVILKSPNGTRYRITVNNDGSLTTTAL